MTDPEESRALGRREHQDEVLREALSVGRTYAEAGELAGVSERTVRRRMGDPEFARAVSMRRGERVGAITGQLIRAGDDAVGVLLECLAAESEPIRIRAAQLLLTLGTQLRHAHELEERITALEERDDGEQA